MKLSTGSSALSIWIPGLPSPADNEPDWQWPGPDDHGPLAEALRRKSEQKAPSVQLADAHWADDPEARILQLLGVEYPAEYLHAGFAVAQQVSETDLVWVAAFDPIHLKAETDHAIVLGRRFVQPSANECQQLASAMNAFVQQDGLTVWAEGNNVYLGAYSTADFAVDSLPLTPLSYALNRNAGAFIQPGQGGGQYQRLQTELQMLLYNHPVNEQRARQGQPEINAFWAHRASSLPARPVAQPAIAAGLVTDSLLLQQYQADALAELSMLSDAQIIAYTEPGWCRLEGDLAGFQQALTNLDQKLQDLQVPKLVVTNTAGYCWRSPNRWQRWFQRLNPSV